MKFLLSNIVVWSFLALPASAADLTLHCRTTETHANGSQYDLNIRFDITWEVGTVREYHNRGSGWKIEQVYRFVRADNSEIVLRNSKGQYEVIDRNTGSHYYKYNKPSGGVVIQRGTCGKAENTNDGPLF